MHRKNIESYDVYMADEAFMTGTPLCMLPVTSLNGEKINDGKVDRVTDRLLEKWSKNMGVGLVKQIKDWSKEKNQMMELIHLLIILEDNFFTAKFYIFYR